MLGQVRIIVLYVTQWRSLILGGLKVGNPKTHTPHISAISVSVYVYVMLYMGLGKLSGPRECIN